MFLNLLTSGSDITDSCRNFSECLWENLPELKPVHFDYFSVFLLNCFSKKCQGLDVLFMVVRKRLIEVQELHYTRLRYFQASEPRN